LGELPIIIRFATAAACAAVALMAGAPASAACSIRTTPIPVAMKGLRPMVTAKIKGKIYFTCAGGAPFRVPRPQQAEATR
jgi:hypothetical protein